MGQVGGLRVEVTAPIDATYLIYTVQYGAGNPEVKMQITEGVKYPYFLGYDFLKTSNIIGLDNKLEKSNNNIEFILKGMHASLYGNTPLLSIDYINKNVILNKEGKVKYGDDRIIIKNEDTPLYWDWNEYVLMVANKETQELILKRFLIDNVMENDIVLGLMHPSKPIMYVIDIDKCEVNGEMFINEQTKQAIEDSENSLSGESKFFLLDDVTGTYEKPMNVEGGSVDDALNLLTSYAQRHI